MERSRNVSHSVERWVRRNVRDGDWASEDSGCRFFKYRVHRSGRNRGLMSYICWAGVPAVAVIDIDDNGGAVSDRPAAKLRGSVSWWMASVIALSHRPRLSPSQ